MKALSQGDIYTIVILKVLNKRNTDYPAAILNKANDLLTHRSINRRYFYSTVAKAQGDELIKISDRTDKLIYYRITEKGMDVFKTYHKTFYPSMEAIKTVVDRLESVLKNQQLHPEKASLLHADYRSFFSRLFSAKDVIRYYTIKQLQVQPSLFMAEVSEILNEQLGWSPSIGYLYEIAHEMEEGELLVGKWNNDIRRNKRYYRLTDEGAHHFKQIEESTYVQTKQNKKYLAECLQLLV
ncbi:helix-turn-helix transcriptional regulator [Salipaludibacillus sp. HK11]|uniref:helix-turn-helix transcriptional regulator n=1 Tax=Salipaludibacillus sp. HK11 TaxID=3394320 RepID=UPI0039FCE624